MPLEHIQLFTQVDRTQDPDFFARFLAEAACADGQAELRDHARHELRLRDGAQVLDVGCGTGGEAIHLAGQVGREGRVIGVDVSEALIARATRQSETLGLPLTFEVGDAQRLRFESASFDAARAERLLVHLADPRRVVDEMTRVTRPGGRVVIVDVDHDTLTIDAGERAVTRRIITSFADRVRNGWIGRQLFRVARDAGLADVTVTMHNLRVHFELATFLLGGHLAAMQKEGILSPAEAAAWWHDLERAQERGVFFVGITMFVAAGTKVGGKT